MKKLFFLTLLISSLAISQDIKYLSEYSEFKPGTIAYLFGNDVKLRAESNTDSSVLTLLKIGEKIKVLEKTNLTMLFDGIESPWYKVQFQDKIGFVLGALIAIDKSSYGGINYLVSLKKEKDNLYLKTRVVENGEDYLENISLLDTSDFYIKAYGNKGLDNVKSIFEIKYLAEACGVNGGGIYMFYFKKQLIKVIDYTEVVDGDTYWFHEKYVFPSDYGGEKGKILYKSKSGETIDYETEWVEEKLVNRTLEWKNGEIHPKNTSVE